MGSLRRGTLRILLSHPLLPFLRGARGDLALIVKQHSLTGFEVKLTPMGSLRRGTLRILLSHPLLPFLRQGCFILCRGKPPVVALMAETRIRWLVVG